MNIRNAVQADNAALCALESRTPLDSGDSKLFVERSDFFALHRLQERSVVMLAEEDGEVIGACAGALNEAPIAGQKRLLLYIHHERIAEEHQRKGIGGALTRAVADYWKEQGVGQIDSSYWIIGATNLKSRNFAERSDSSKPWPRPVESVSFSAIASDELPKRVGAGPIFDIVRLINRTHAGKELFTPYEQVGFGQRLSRSTEYGWGDIYGRLSNGKLTAMAGVWDYGASTALRTGDGPASRSLAVLDYGYEVGAEEEMALLIAQLCALAGRRERQSVRLFLDTDSDLYSEASHLPHQVSTNLLYTPRIEPPRGPAVIYVDPVLF